MPEEVKAISFNHENYFIIESENQKYFIGAGSVSVYKNNFTANHTVLEDRGEDNGVLLAKII